MKVVCYERPVYYYETDRMDCVHHSNYIRWFEEARIFFMRETGASYEDMEAMGILSPVLAAEAEYKSMTHFGETVMVETSVQAYTGTRITWAYTVRDKATGAVRCTGVTRHCFLGEKGRPVSLKKAAPAYDQAVREWMEASES